VQGAATRLQDSGELLADEEMDRERNNSAGRIEAGSLSLEQLINQWQVPPADSITFDEAIIELELGLPAGWIAAHDGLTLNLIASPSLQQPDLGGLGPETWLLGTGIQVRRLRNPEPLTAREAGDRFPALITRHGELIDSRDIELDGLPAVEHSVGSQDGDWTTKVIVTVAGEFTYFIESGCPAALDAACDAAAELVSGVKLLPE
jgi:hypothetical protein